eukprot:gene10087-10965_t
MSNPEKPAPLLIDLSLLNPEYFQDCAALRARKNFSKTLTFKIFLVFSSLLSLVEPILVGFRPVNEVFALQVAVLAASTFTFFLDIAFTAYYYDRQYDREKLAPWQIAVAICQGEVLLDAFCLVFGWCTIFQNPGLAALRCLRVFRLLWYYELFPDMKDVNFDPAQAVFSFRKASQLCLLYMKGVAQEIFTQKSKGGIVVIAIYLYLSYLIAVVFWIETKHMVSINEGVAECIQLNTCFITMIRLSFYDGNGFDFMQTLALEGYSGYTFLIFVYMLLSAVVILNGLIGIFGGAFVSAVDDSPSSNSDPDTLTNNRSQGRTFLTPAKPSAPPKHIFPRMKKYASVLPGFQDNELFQPVQDEVMEVMRAMRDEMISLKTTVMTLHEEVRRVHAKNELLLSRRSETQEEEEKERLEVHVE